MKLNPSDKETEKKAVEALLRAFAASELSLTGMMTFCIAATTITAQKAPLVSTASAIDVAIKIHEEVAAEFGVKFEIEFDETPPNSSYAETLASHIEQTVANLQAIKSGAKH